jgi:diphthamide biosynthesis protein 3
MSSAAIPIKAKDQETGEDIDIIPIELLGVDNDDETGIYDTIEIEDMTYNEDLDTFFYPCPCGDKFAITSADLRNGDDIATCPSCSLRVKVIYNIEDFAEYE